MPPKVRFNRENIINAAYQLARQNGLEAVNAREVAKQIGCSTQPLFREFQTMDQIKAEAKRLALEEYDRRIAESDKQSDMPPYKAVWVAYIGFAREEPKLFQMLFMCDRSKQPRQMVMDNNIDYYLRLIMEHTGCRRDEARMLHIQMWIFAHGLAAMVATSYLEFTDEEISALLSLQFETAQQSEKQAAK